MSGVPPHMRPESSVEKLALGNVQRTLDLIGGNEKDSKVDYYRQSSTVSAHDPRDIRSLPRPTREFKFPLLSMAKNWIGGEPCRHLFIDRLSSKDVKNELNLLAVLEEISSHLSVDKIELLPSLTSERLCASVVFSSGFEAWEFCRKFQKMSQERSFTWKAELDRGAKMFDRIEFLQRAEQQAHRNRDRVHDRDRDPKSPSTPSRKRPPTLSCNPFVPCLTIPFSCGDELPFRLDENVIATIFPASRFPSISEVEEGSTSWHVHFGREVDVVEADKMLQQDVFLWSNHRFYFDRWKLTKNGHFWRIPEPFPTTTTHNTATSATSIYDQEMKIPLKVTGTATETDISSLALALPKFVKKNRIAFEEDKGKDSGNWHGAESNAETPIERLEGSNDNVVTDDLNVSLNTKLRVKRKSLKKRPFASTEFTLPPASSTQLENPNVLEDAIKETEIEEEFQELPTLPVELASGSARLEGFFRLEPSVKAHVRFPGVLEAFSSRQTSVGSDAAASNTNDTGRSSRAQNRRPFTTQNNHIALDLFKVSPLQSTQKLVALRDSSIHSYGLIVMESAEVGDLIIEYVGELVRASVANIREWHYEREYQGDGIASSYLFRLDDIMVVDATFKGNLARFVNHSCDPNCVAKTITLNGSKRIVMYAKRHIKAGEEVTYDYKFPIEKDPKKKVRCLCGSNACRNFLN